MGSLLWLSRRITYDDDVNVGVGLLERLHDDSMSKECKSTAAQGFASCHETTFSLFQETASIPPASSRSYLPNSDFKTPSFPEQKHRRIL